MRGIIHQMRRFLQAWREAFRRHPLRTACSISLAVVIWIAEEMFGDEIFGLLHEWAVRRSDVAVAVIQFIAAHSIWIPWGLVPLMVLLVLILGTLDAHRIMRERIVPVGQMIERDLREQARRWLGRRLSEKKLHVDQALFFGSVLDDWRVTSDVDVIVVFKPIKTERQLVRIVRRLKDALCADFKRTFSHSLHLQFFTADEQERFQAFLNRGSRVDAITFDDVRQEQGI
jgi:predicted nucleotidyltransferase